MQVDATSLLKTYYHIFATFAVYKASACPSVVVFVLRGGTQVELAVQTR